MNWPGKAECFKTIQRPSMATLRPSPDESINFDTTENLIIEGDNLEVLKLLQKSYLGKVKTIYIDPPYNTGNDWMRTRIRSGSGRLSQCAMLCAIALALRCDAPIYVDEEVVRKQSTEALDEWLKNVKPEDFGKYTA